MTEERNRRSSSRASSVKRAGSFAARLRSRSASKTRINGHGQLMRNQQQQHEETAPPRNLSSSSKNRIKGHGQMTRNPQQQHEETAPPRNSSSSSQATGQIEGIVERHQCAMKTDLQEFIETREKEEVDFWKDKAIKLKKRVSFLERELRDQGGEGSDKGKDSDQISSEKVSQLEIKLQDRDVQLVSLREAMASQENASEERVRLLEHQLERLVELPTKVRSGSFQRPPSTASTQPPTSDSEKSNISDSEKVGTGTYDNPTLEISALEQLLARVLAEKDRLQYENDNLRSVVREEGSRSSDVTKDKPSISNDVTKDNPSISNDATNFKRSRSSGAADSKPPPTSNDAPNHNAPISDETMYKLSCRSSPEQSFVGITSEDLKKTVNKHFLHVWEIVRTSKGRGHRGSAEPEKDGANNNFRDSILAHHIAAVYCRDMECEKDVRKWCKKNLKLEKIVSADSSIEELTRSALSSSCEF